MSHSAAKTSSSEDAITSDRNPQSKDNESMSETQKAVVQPLEISEDNPSDEVQYPTGAKFAVVAMALGLSLALVGLVGILRAALGQHLQ